MTKDAAKLYKGLETLALHAGTPPDPSTGARSMPVHFSTAFVFRDAAHAADLFALKEFGYSYSRLTNPTVNALEERIAALEGGIGATCAASGHGGQLLVLSALMQPGDHVVASSRLYGGSVNQRNGPDLVALADVDGLFVGRAAWTPEGFAGIARIVAEAAGRKAA